MRASLACSLVLMALGCVPTRAPIVLACYSQSDCPADGMHLCNVETHRCEPCDGKCQELLPDVQVTAKDVAAETDGTADQSDAVPDQVDTAVDAPDASTLTCAGKCGEFAGGAACQCDSGCEGIGDCCPDYAALCKK